VWNFLMLSAFPCERTVVETECLGREGIEVKLIFCLRYHRAPHTLWHISLPFVQKLVENVCGDEATTT
jgi:hypothetical protein